MFSPLWRSYIFCVDSSRITFRCVYLFQFFNVCDQNISYTHAAEAALAQEASDVKGLSTDGGVEVENLTSVVPTKWLLTGWAKPGTRLLVMDS